MVSKNLQQRLKLADAMASYLRVNNPTLPTEPNNIVEHMRPKKLQWTDSVAGQNTGADPFSSWCESTTPFYMTVDFHIAAFNLIINHPDEEVDLNGMFDAVSAAFYANGFNTDQPGHHDQATEIGVAGNIEVSIEVDMMHPTVAAAATEYRVFQMEYLQLAPNVNDYKADDGSAGGANKPSNIMPSNGDGDNGV